MVVLFSLCYPMCRSSGLCRGCPLRGASSKPFPRVSLTWPWSPCLSAPSSLPTWSPPPSLPHPWTMWWQFCTQWFLQHWTPSSTAWRTRSSRVTLGKWFYGCFSIVINFPSFSRNDLTWYLPSGLVRLPHCNAGVPCFPYFLFSCMNFGFLNKAGRLSWVWAFIVVNLWYYCFTCSKDLQLVHKMVWSHNYLRSGAVLNQGANAELSVVSSCVLRWVLPYLEILDIFYLTNEHRKVINLMNILISLVC